MKKTLCAIGIFLALTTYPSTWANGGDHHHHTPTHIDNSKPLPALESRDRLGKLNFTIATMHRFDTDNGVAVIFTPLSTPAMVDITVNFEAGSAYDDVFGSSNMTATMLTQGTNKLSENEFISQVEQLASILSASSGKDTLRISLRSLSKKDTLNPSVDLLIEALSNANFDDTILARNKEQLTTALLQSQESPNYVAGVVSIGALFGDHPYAHPTTGTIESIQQITPSTLKQFKNTYLVANNAKITITGDLSLDDATKIANRISVALPKGQKAATIKDPIKPKPTHIHIDFPSSQTVITMGHLTDKFKSDPKSLKTASDFGIANDVLAGGDFNARLMDTIRVKKGYTYGIYGNEQKLNSAGIYTVNFSTQQNMAKDAINETLEVINNTKKTGINQDEMTLSISNSINSFPTVFASNSGIHGLANTLNNRDLPNSYLAEYSTLLQNTTLGDVNNALEIIKPDEFVIITVGESKPDI